MLLSVLFSILSFSCVAIVPRSPGSIVDKFFCPLRFSYLASISISFSFARTKFAVGSLFFLYLAGLCHFWFPRFTRSKTNWNDEGVFVNVGSKRTMSCDRFDTFTYPSCRIDHRDLVKTAFNLWCIAIAFGASCGSENVMKFDRPICSDGSNAQLWDWKDWWQ
jgi:hypothetical protein